MTHRHVVFGFFDIVFSITTLFHIYNYFSENKVVFIYKEKSSRIRNLLKVIIVLFLFLVSVREIRQIFCLFHLTNFVYSSVVSLPSSPLTNTIDEFVACER